MKKLFKRFGVVFLAVLFLFCSFTVSVFAADVPDQTDQSDQTETTAVESSAAERSAIVPMIGDSETVQAFYYVPSGWTCEAGTAFSDIYIGMFHDPINVSFLSNIFMVGYEYVENSDEQFIEKTDSIVVGLALDGLNSIYFNLTPDMDFLGFFSYSIDSPCCEFFENEAECLGLVDSSGNFEFSNEDAMSGTYSIPMGWSVEPGYIHETDSYYSFYLNDKLYEGYFVAMGYTVSDGVLVEAENSIVLYKDSLDTAIQLTSEDSFTLRIADSFSLLYFSLHNGILMPPTLIESIFDIFLSIGEWISGATSALISMFWDSTNSTLTFVGTLSVAGLAISVSFLLISFLEKFLRFGG